MNGDDSEKRDQEGGQRAELDVTLENRPGDIPGDRQVNGSTQSQPARHLGCAPRPLLRAFRQTGGNRFLPMPWNGIARDPQCDPALVDRRRDHLLRLGDHVPAVKERLARKHFVEGRAERINVVRRRGIVPEHLLRTHVVERFRRDA